MISSNKIQKKERVFYVLISSMMLLVFSVYLIIRHIRHTMIGPIILTAYFIISIFSVFLLILAIKKSIKARYLLFEAGFILLLIFVVETSLRMINYPLSIKSRYSIAAYNKLKSLISLKEEGLNAAPRIPPDAMRRFGKNCGIDLYFGDIGDSYIVGMEEDDEMIVYKSDANGFRNASGLYENNDSFDVFLLGCSFAAGSAVPDGFSISDYIKKGTSLSIYNAGYPGTGLIIQLAVFLEYGLKKRPKNVVLILIEGITLNRTLQEIKDDKLRNYLKFFKPNNIVEKNPLKDKQLKRVLEIEYLKSLSDYMEKNYKKTRERFTLEGFMGNCKILLLIQNFVQTYSGEGCIDVENIEVAKNIAQEIFQYYRDSAKSYDGNFLIVYLPYTRFYFNKWSNREYEMVSSLCGKLNIPFIDMVKVLSEFENPKDFFARNAYRPTIGGHCNRKGYQLVADEIIKQLLPKE